jgi:hypothetical protein
MMTTVSLMAPLSESLSIWKDDILTR